MDTRSTFAKNLRLLRISHGISQTELADRLGVNQRTISAWETGICEPDLNTLSKICSVFNEDYNGLLT